jgi:hypothetical protein
MVARGRAGTVSCGSGDPEVDDDVAGGVAFEYGQTSWAARDQGLGLLARQLGDVDHQLDLETVAGAGRTDRDIGRDLDRPGGQALRAGDEA